MYANKIKHFSIPERIRNRKESQVYHSEGDAVWKAIFITQQGPNQWYGTAFKNNKISSFLGGEDH